MYDDIKQSLPILTGHLHVFPGKSLLRCFALFTIRPFVILTLGSPGCPGCTPLSDPRLPHVFPQSGAWLFTFLTIPSVTLPENLVRGLLSLELH